MEAYPQVWDEEQDIDINERERFAYIDGYEKAEKDLSLTWEDIALIDDLLCEVPSMNREEYYTEVLKRFKEAKK